PTPPTPPTAKPLTVTKVSQAHRRWHETGRRGHGRVVGTTFRFRLDRAAAVKLAFRHRGRQPHKTTMTIAGRAGANRITFSGRLPLTVSGCGVCRTDLHLRDQEIAATKLPIVLGHQIVARTEDGRRVGVPWLGWTDGTCRYCTSGRENLCVQARFTGRDIDGG